MLAILATIARDAYAADLTSPSFLVATRDMQDPMFRQTVILMLPSQESPLIAGVIINRPSNVRVRQMFPQARQLGSMQDTVYIGGPVETGEVSLIFRAAKAQKSATQVFNDVYVCTDHDAIADILKDSQITDLRVIAGRAQWLRDQLHGEMFESAWYIVPATPGLVFGDPKSLWSTLVKGGEMQEVDATPSRAPRELLLGMLR